MPSTVNNGQFALCQIKRIGEVSVECRNVLQAAVKSILSFIDTLNGHWKQLQSLKQS